MQKRGKLIILLLIVSLVLIQAGAISRRSFWEDEAATASLAPMEFGEIVRARAANNHPPLYWLSAAAWGRVFGYGEWGLKSYSLVWLLIAFLLVIKLTRLLYDERTALIAATLMVFSPYVLTYGSNARYYAMSAAISLFLAWMAKSYIQYGRWTFLVFYLLAGIALLYTLYMGVALLIAINLWYFWAAIRQKSSLPRIAGWIAAQIMILAGYLPWLNILIAAAGRNLDRSFEIGNLMLELPVRFGYVGYAFLNGEFFSPLNPLVWLLILLVLLIGFSAGRSALKNGWLPLTILLVCLCFGVVINLVSIYPQSAWQNLSQRNFFIFPFFVIWLAGSLSNLRPRYTHVSLGIILMIYAAGIFNYFNDVQMIKPLLAVPWREIMQEIETQRTSEAVVQCSGGDIACYYYLRQSNMNEIELWSRERILNEPPLDLWWIQINLGDPIISNYHSASFVDQLLHTYQNSTVTNYAPQDRSIQLIKTELFHQIDYAFRVSLYHFSSPVQSH